MYQKGIGVVADSVKAAEWYQKAVDAGHPMAHVNLGILYQNGNGVPRDYARAMELYRYAADRGVPEGMNDIAYLYLTGMGVAVSLPDGVAWMEKAANAGLAAAQYNMGHFYEAGDVGLPQDYVKAREWLTKAANGGDLDAAYAVGGYYIDGRGVARDLKVAAGWLLPAAKKGHIKSQGLLGALILFNSDRPVEARQWLESAAEHHDLKAQMNLAFYFASTSFAERDDVSALMWTLIAEGHGKDQNITENIATLEGRMTAEQIALARERASAWFKSHS